jgi:hypothetical protein
MTTHRQTEQFEKGMSRRGLVQALTIGAAGSSFSTPAAAQQTAVLAEATSADYVRDPARWGSPEVASLFPGFKHLDMRTNGAVIRLATAVPAHHFCSCTAIRRTTRRGMASLRDLRKTTM